ncbi:MAG: hydroxymethylglutaryl-CoA lyase [Phycisphaerales bacterium]
MNNYVRITEVAPRDGLQNESVHVPTEAKVRFIRLLEATGVDEVEVTSFVHPKRVPQLADAAELVAALADGKPEGIVYSVLVPNQKGLERMLEVNDRARVIDKIAVFTAASEGFAKANIGATIEESITRFRPLVELARQAGLLVRGYVSCAFACPFDGPTDPASVTRVTARLLALGVDEIDIADTIGAATPESVERLIGVLHDRLGPCRETEIGDPCLTLHLHDTNGRAAACVQKALEMGVRSFDSSAAGLGGCPFAATAATRAPGNIATDVLVRTVTQAGYRTGVDPDRLDRATRAAGAVLAGETFP